MEPQLIDHDTASLRPWRWLAVRAGGFILSACMIAAWSLSEAGNDGFAAYYFFSQDAVA